MPPRRKAQKMAASPASMPTNTAVPPTLRNANATTKQPSSEPGTTEPNNSDSLIRVDFFLEPSGRSAALSGYATLQPIVLPDVPCHITQRGVDRCETFSSIQDVRRDGWAQTPGRARCRDGVPIATVHVCRAVVGKQGFLEAMSARMGRSWVIGRPRLRADNHQPADEERQRMLVGR